jgi:CRP-like cAMP-binding protein
LKRPISGATRHAFQRGVLHIRHKPAGCHIRTDTTQGQAMYIKQSELFLGTSMDFVRKFMDVSEMSSHPAGEILFRENDTADRFYILLNGCVLLSLEKPPKTVYRAERNGEAFGWSSLIGDNIYSASAECLKPTTVLKTDSRKFSVVLNNDPANGAIFFKHLAATLGKRLLESYKLIDSGK